MRAQDWFESFFVQGRFAEELERVPADQNEREAAFIAEALELPSGARILDLCCGVGRHTVPLATRGYRMSGLDLDAAALEKARRRADEAGVEVAWHQRDMRNIPYQGKLDAVLNVGSSWGYYGTDEEDAKVLASVARALKPGGAFLLDVANREAIFRGYQANSWHERRDGTLVLTQRELDLVSSRNRVVDVLIDPDGTRSERWHRFRFYSLTELSRMLPEAGLELRRTWGGLDGSPYGLSSPRLVVLARKPADDAQVISESRRTAGAGAG